MMNFDMDRSLGFLLNRTAIASKVSFNSLIKEYEISPEQWSVIFRVTTSDGITQKELADSTYKDQGNLTRMLSKLIEKGYIIKEVDQKDKRAFRLYATEFSYKIVKEISDLSAKHNQTLTQGLSKEEAEQLIELLNKVYRNIN